MEIVIWLTVGSLVGAPVGAALTYRWLRAREGGDTIEHLKRENQEFREEVTEHFVETERLVNRLTVSYKEVYDHLHEGASKLVDEPDLAERLPDLETKEVRLLSFRTRGQPTKRSSEKRQGKKKRTKRSRKPTPKVDFGDDDEQ